VCAADDLCEGFDDAMDGDYDGVPDGCDLCSGYDDTDDMDDDTIPDACDNCPFSRNPLQVNEDNDALGEVCDCDDTNFLVNRLAAEVCDGLDNDCDGTIDGPTAEDVGYWYEDADSDGEGNPDTEVISCDQPDGYVGNDLDCDDTTRGVRSSAPDACDGLDNDCDGIIDNDCDNSEDTDAEGGAGPKSPGVGETQCACNGSGGVPSAVWGLLAMAVMVRRRRV
jgi:uncharacterized protein (TIGR03382 family)